MYLYMDLSSRKSKVRYICISQGMEQFCSHTYVAGAVVCSQILEKFMYCFACVESVSVPRV